jgi:hypothetical protein
MLRVSISDPLNRKERTSVPRVLCLMHLAFAGGIVVCPWKKIQSEFQGPSTAIVDHIAKTEWHAPIITDIRFGKKISGWILLLKLYSHEMKIASD